MEKRNFIIFVIILILAALIVYFIFFYYQNCETKGCFDKSLAKCSKAEYVSETEQASWLYKVKGKEGDNCKVEVKLLQLKQGDEKLTSLEGKKMKCYLPYGLVSRPERSLERCHGLLKEEMQKVIINRLHSYIVDNLGEISEGLEEPL